MKTATVSDTEVSFIDWHGRRVGARTRAWKPRDHLRRRFIPARKHAARRRVLHQRLAGVNPCRFHDVFAELEMIGRQHDDRRSVLEPPELNAFVDYDVARKD